MTTTTAQFETLTELQAVELLRARFGRLLGVGYDPTSALIVASHVEVDVTEAVELAQRGCPPALALRILL